MKEFIEVTNLMGEKLLQATKDIFYVDVSEYEETFICTGTDGKGCEVGLYVMESYEEIKAQLLG